MAHPDDLLTTVEFAAIAKIKPNTAEIWRGQGKGPPFIKMGTDPRAPVRYRRADVIEWLEKRIYSSTSAYTAALRTLTPTKSTDCRSSGASE